MAPVPLTVYVMPFADKGVAEPARWSCDDAAEALNVVNSIWSKADIAFVIKDCSVDKPLDIAKSMRNKDQGLLAVLTSRHKPDNTVHIYLVNAIENLNAGGGSYPNSDPEPASFVQWYSNTVSNGRAWAHELGHLMSLDHVKIDYQEEKQAAQRINNLMVEGLTVGKDLTDKQMSAARGSPLVKRFGG
jgi:hypothetical protein